jgi:hypothetical protein
MAKKKDKKDKGKAAKAPKTDTGAKLPKSLRESGEMISSLVTSPVARELVADALIAIAGVLVGNKKTREAVTDAGSQAASGAKELGQTATGAVAEVVSEAARRILPSSVTGEEGGSGKGEGAAKPRGAQSGPARGAKSSTKGGTGRAKKPESGSGEGRPGFIE